MIDNLTNEATVKERLRLVESDSLTGFWKYTPSTDTLEWDERMFEMYGVDPVDFYGNFSDWERRVHEEDVEDSKSSFEKSLETGGAFKYFFRIRTPLGVRFIRAAASPLVDENGRIIRMIGSNIDVTSQVQDQMNLERSAKLYETFIEQTPHAMAMVDNNMVYIAASQKWLDDYGIRNVEVIGRSHYDVFPEIGDEWKRIHAECLQGKGAVNDRDRFDRADGSVQYLRWNLQPWYKGNGQIGGILMFSEDITKRVLQEEEHSAIISALESTKELAQIGVWSFDLENNELSWDDVVRKIHGVSEDFVPAPENAIEFYKEGVSRQTIEDAFKGLLERGETYDVQIQIVNTAGEFIWVRTLGKPEYGEKGKLVRASGLIQNINTEKVAQIEREIRHNEFENAFKYSPNGMALVSVEGHWIKVNARLCTLLGYTEDELLKLSFQEVTHPEDLSLDLELLQETLDGKRTSYMMEKRYIRKDGALVYVILNVSLIRDTMGDPLHFVSQIQDITYRVHAEQKLEESNTQLLKMAERLSLHNRSLTDFAHIASHNLRAPVGNLMALSGLYDQLEEDEKPEIVHKIKSEVSRLAETLDDLIEVLVVKEATPENSVSIDLPKLVNRITATLGHLIQESGMSITTDFDAVDKIQSNATYMESVFLNFISNAIKYRRLDVKSTLHIASERMDDRVLIHFIDNGLGINLQRHGDKVFGLYKRFHRAEDSKGVGLFMVKAHVEALGGQVSVQSEVGEGSTFTVELPFVRGE